MKYLLVTGGVISGIGKGIISSSIGVILKGQGWNVTCIKIDPYLNIDAGTFSPYEHGEVYVLDDGSEVDLDLGNYERFLDVKLCSKHNITTGKIYQQVTQRERRGDYLGKTVQVVPHITDAIQQWVKDVAQIPVDASGGIPDICIIELGGTIGDIESMPFVEAFRQLHYREGPQNFCCVHVSLVPNLSTVGEPKTKPTQISIRELRARGLQADIIFCRCSLPLPPHVIDKLGLFCQVPRHQVLTVLDVDSLYKVPILLEEQNLPQILLKHFDLQPKPIVNRLGHANWRSIVALMARAHKQIRIAIVGKYTKLADAYLSLTKALEHAAMHTNYNLKVDFVCTEDLEPSVAESAPETFHEAWLAVSGANGVVVPGGFGVRGTEGKIAVIRYCREHGVPFLGICLGFQLAVTEFARNVLGWKTANSTEFDPETSYPVVIDMPEFNPGDMGGTMRLGRRRTNFMMSDDAASYISTTYGLASSSDSLGEVDRLKCATDGIHISPGVASDNYEYAGTTPKQNNGFSTPKHSDYKCLRAHSYIYKLCNSDHFYARHRHRYEVNPDIISAVESKGFVFLGRDAEVGNRMEIGELMTPLVKPSTSLRSTLSSGDNLSVLQRHPYFVGTQFHPELTSRPLQPSPFFLGLVLAAANQLQLTLLGENSSFVIADGVQLGQSQCNGSMPVLSLFDEVQPISGIQKIESAANLQQL